MEKQGFFLLLIAFILACGVVTGENQSVEDNSTGTDQDVAVISYELSLQEKLMNLALKARSFALENEKSEVLAEFSNPSGLFCSDGIMISAYDDNGILLADCARHGDIGSRFISDDHDSGQVRLMRDLSTTGGGLFTDAASGKFWFVADVDGSWWICAGLNPDNNGPA